LDSATKVSVSELNIAESEDLQYLNKKIYLKCSCGPECSVGVISVSADVEKDAGIVFQEVVFEFPVWDPVGNLTCHQKFKYSWLKFLSSIISTYKRIKLAVDIIAGNPIYVPSDVYLKFSEARELSENLIKAIDEMESHRI